MALRQARIYGNDHRDARKFTERLIAALSRGLERIT
jgi:hypothetical protein